MTLSFLNRMITFHQLISFPLPQKELKYQRSFELIESDDDARGGKAIFSVSITDLAK